MSLRRALAAALTLCLWVGTPLQPHAWETERIFAAARKLGPATLSSARALESTVSAAKPLDDAAKLTLINNFFNQRIVFKDDVEVWGVKDHWASPLEVLDKGAGDCEDYAIGKYFSLLAAGVPSTRMRLVYVRADLGLNGARLAHMVVAYYARPGDEPLILDNFAELVLPASRRPDLMPVFSFNSEGLWQGVGSQSAGNPFARLSPWRDALGRARAEGFH